MCTHSISFSINMKIILSLQLFDFSKGLKNVETAVVNEPSVFEPLKFYCKCFLLIDKRFFYIYTGRKCTGYTIFSCSFSDILVCRYSRNARKFQRKLTTSQIVRHPPCSTETHVFDIDLRWSVIPFWASIPKPILFANLHGATGLAGKCIVSLIYSNCTYCLPTSYFPKFYINI